MVSSTDSNSAEELPIDADSLEPRPRRGHSPGRVLAAIAVGGALGGPTRYGLGLAFPTAPHTFPATTFAINVSGSFLLALLVVLILEVWPPTIYVRPFLCVGFLGAYTTFSTWMVDTDRLISAGAWGTAVADLVLSLVAGLGATALGLSVGRGIATRRSPREAVPAAADVGTEADPRTESDPEPDAEPETIGGRR